MPGTLPEDALLSNRLSRTAATLLFSTSNARPLPLLKLLSLNVALSVEELFAWAKKVADVLLLLIVLSVGEEVRRAAVDGQQDRLLLLLLATWLPLSVTLVVPAASWSWRCSRPLSNLVVVERQPHGTGVLASRSMPWPAESLMSQLAMVTLNEPLVCFRWMPSPPAAGDHHVVQRDVGGVGDQMPWPVVFWIVPPSPKLLPPEPTESVPVPVTLFSTMPLAAAIDGDALEGRAGAADLDAVEVKADARGGGDRRCSVPLNRIVPPPVAVNPVAGGRVDVEIGESDGCARVGRETHRGVGSPSPDRPAR